MNIYSMYTKQTYVGLVKGNNIREASGINEDQILAEKKNDINGGTIYFELEGQVQSLFLEFEVEIEQKGTDPDNTAACVSDLVNDSDVNTDETESVEMSPEQKAENKGIFTRLMKENFELSDERADVVLTAQPLPFKNLNSGLFFEPLSDADLAGMVLPPEPPAI